MDLDAAGEEPCSSSGHILGENGAVKRRKTYKDPVPFLFSEGETKDEVLDSHIEAELNSNFCDEKGVDYNRVAHTVTVGVACRLGHTELVRQLLVAGHGTFPDDRNWWPIHEAAYGLHYECCKLLIEVGHADVNARAHDGVTPLILVCRRDHNHQKAYEIARLLLQSGADPNLCSLDEMTPLIQAIKSKNRKLIDLLLDSGANPKQKWYNGWSTLHEAANSHDVITMKRLLELGVDLHAVDDDRHSVLFVAVQEGYLPCVELALSAAGNRDAELANKRLSDGCSCVMVAATEGYYNILCELIAHGADCNLTVQPVWGAAGGGVHALAAAAQRNFWRCVEVLLPHVDRRVVENTELDPMSAAAFCGSTESIRMMLDYGFSTEVPTIAPSTMIIVPYLQPVFIRGFHTPLREAVRKGHSDAVKVLIKAGAKMTYKSHCYSPFLFSFRNRLDPSIMRCFLEHDVDINSVCEGSVCKVPDALLAILGTENRKKLLQLLKCGLKPSLKEWCSCSNKTGYSLLYDVKQASYITDFTDLIKLLSVFSPYIPSCCSEVAKAIGCEPQIASLQHLCRLAIRDSMRPSQLLNERWLDGLPGLPKPIKKYLSFSPMPLRFEYFL